MFKNYKLLLFAGLFAGCLAGCTSNSGVVSSSGSSNTGISTNVKIEESSCYTIESVLKLLQNVKLSRGDFLFIDGLATNAAPICQNIGKNPTQSEMLLLTQDQTLLVNFLNNLTTKGSKA